MPDPTNAAAPAQTSKTALQNQVGERFGVLPNFFQLALETPEITEKLWAFAQFAYLDNPLPSLFKERLFVYLSRFCAVRYCIARHAGFLIGLGRPSGDPQERIQTVADAVRLLKRKFPRGQDLEPYLTSCAAHPLLTDMPLPDSTMEDNVIVFSSHVFLQTGSASDCLLALERLLGPARLQYLLLFMTFIRAAHYWTKTHSDLVFEDDIKHLLATQEALAECILNDPEAESGNILQSLVDELPALRQQADKAIGLLAAIVDSSEDAIVSKKLDGTITSWNEGAERLFGYTSKEAVGRHISLIIPENRIDEEVAILDRISQGERVPHFDTVRVRKDGTLVHISVAVSPVRNAGGEVVGASKVARDISQRKEAERALQESEDRFRSLANALDIQAEFRTQELSNRNAAILQQTQQLQYLSRQLLRIRDEEGRRIARELHDSAGQNLAALSMTIRRLGTKASSDSDAISKDIQEAQDLIDHLSKEIRTTSYLLHPPLLEENGLKSALGWYVQGLTERSGLDLSLAIPAELGRLAPDIELTVFRLVQEALTNVHRHSGSKTAVIRISRDADKVYVEIQDRGKGITPDRLAKIRSGATGVGIAGMRERICQFDGELNIESNALGTKVCVTLRTDPQGKR